jgi:hypothetical protein
VGRDVSSSIRRPLSLLEDSPSPARRGSRRRGDRGHIARASLAAHLLTRCLHGIGGCSGGLHANREVASVRRQGRGRRSGHARSLSGCANASWPAANGIAPNEGGRPRRGRGDAAAALTETTPKPLVPLMDRLGPDHPRTPRRGVLELPEGSCRREQVDCSRTRRPVHIGARNDTSSEAGRRRSGSPNRAGKSAPELGVVRAALPSDPSRREVRGGA